MGSIITGAVAMVVGGGLAFATVLGVVNLVNETPTQPESSVMDYGTNQ